MPNKKRLTTRDIRPCLSTSEAMKVSQTTRGTLRHYANAGILHSYGRTESDYNRWTFDQITDLTLIQQMRSNGMSLDDIGERAAEGKTALREAAYNSSVASIRTNRRVLKSIVHLRKLIKRFDAVGMRDGYYLRYLPQRWMALLPVAEDMAGLLDMDAYVEGFTNLKNIVSIVGWSPTYSNGTLTSISTGKVGSTTYIFEELASPPMPCTTGSRIVDGGCYRFFDSAQNPECEDANCEECSRFGRAVTAADTLDWSTAIEAGHMVDRTVLPERVQSPYLTGFWADTMGSAATTGRFALDAAQVPAWAPNGKGKPAKSQGKKELPTVRPRLMPQNCTLPLCATACILPEGFYLCCQNDYEQRDGILQQVLAKLPSRRVEITPERELAMSQALLERSAKWAESTESKRPGPFVEPFAAPRDFGDPNLFGFVRDIGDDDMSALALYTNAALAPEDGFIAVHTEAPVEARSNKLRQELQILVDASNLLMEA